MATVLDYSTGRPSGAAVADEGHAGVVRYIGTPGRPKNLTRAEYQDMAAHGRGVALVYENHGGDAAGGRSAGVLAAQTARADADACGFPRDRPIYFAVDSDQVSQAQFAAVMAYLDGVASVLGAAQVGVYGEYDVIEQAVGPHARYGWQTAAWSKGKKSSKAALYQKIGTVVVGGVECDESDVLAADWGQHNYTAPVAHNEEDDDVSSDVIIGTGTGADQPWQDLVVPVNGHQYLRIASTYQQDVIVEGISMVDDTPGGKGTHGVTVQTGGEVDADRPGPWNLAGADKAFANYSHVVARVKAPAGAKVKAWINDRP
ncbi:DUF1906 domain-containing protein [Amycolatopsis sp. CA-161197]|uniref:DUF1906 domain-containing protein n=1 Tax=Amycolatopsis sp. CA-161197 TaxID=3239922 RepID=UPI003D91662E